MKSVSYQNMENFSLNIKINKIIYNELKELLTGGEDLDSLLSGMIETYKKERVRSTDDFIRSTGRVNALTLPTINDSCLTSQEDYLSTERIYNNYVSQIS